LRSSYFCPKASHNEQLSPKSRDSEGHPYPRLEQVYMFKVDKQTMVDNATDFWITFDDRIRDTAWHPFKLFSY
jgi:hypothetical protein